jgi:hypothetical protein
MMGVSGEDETMQQLPFGALRNSMRVPEMMV